MRPARAAHAQRADGSVTLYSLTPSHFDHLVFRRTDGTIDNVLHYRPWKPFRSAVFQPRHRNDPCTSRLFGLLSFRQQRHSGTAPAGYRAVRPLIHTPATGMPRHRLATAYKDLCRPWSHTRSYRSSCFPSRMDSGAIFRTIRIPTSITLRRPPSPLHSENSSASAVDAHRPPVPTSFFSLHHYIKHYLAGHVFPDGQSQPLFLQGLNAGAKGEYAL